MNVQVKSVVAKIKKDSRLLRLHNAFNDLPYYNLHVEELYDEIKRLHKLRLIRTMKPSDRDYVKKLVEASAQDQSTRSRLSEIRITTIKAVRSLESAVSSLKDYLIVEYSTDLSFVRTKGERENIIDTLLSKYKKYIDAVNSVSEQCLVVIEDIDKAAWSLKLQLDALQMTNRPERSI